MKLGTTQLFSNGFETASLVASSGLLSLPWNLVAHLSAKTHQKEDLFWEKLSNGSDLTIIAFGTTHNHIQPDLLPSTDMMDNPFEFLCSKENPIFSLNQTVMSLFNDHLQRLRELKKEINLKKPVIVTGQGVGGAIASLFTLWLIEKMGSSDKRPFCITFGSPLIGDKSLQQAIARSSNWNSCLLHTVYPRDPLVSSFISNDSYRPFGTFLLCSDSGSTCSENPDSILRLLREMSTLPQRLQVQGYGDIVERLNSKAICKDSDVPSIPKNQPEASFALQLQALGFLNSQLSQNTLVEDLKKQEVLLTKNKRKVFITQKKLNEMKTFMAYLEWYKKTSKIRRRGYYDSYRYDRSPSDHDVVMFVRILNNYWKDMVEEVDKQPQKEGAAFRTGWLYAGTNYRRMVEPLDIAQYYKEGGEDYINNGRSEHYKRLEKWQEEDKKLDAIDRKNMQSILTSDSCLWARVEEALKWLQKCRAGGSSVAEKEEAKWRLEEFEEYVYGLLKKYTVSPEIFLEESSYMRWWNEYKRLKGASHASPLANFMKNYVKYENGEYDFSRE